ncbi:MAG: hypothetical protein FWD53_06220, partial [Phycisphaerales bacterium]|nr:hypothetical protein [Phycisphaerales bacterium]
MKFAGISDFVPCPNSVNTIFSPLATRQVPTEHPRLFGSRADLQKLAKSRPDAYQRMKKIANSELTAPINPSDANADFGAQIGVHSKLFSMALVASIEEDAAMGRKLIDFTFEHFINKPVRVGHVSAGSDAG